MTAEQLSLFGLPAAEAPAADQSAAAADEGTAVDEGTAIDEGAGPAAGDGGDAPGQTTLFSALPPGGRAEGLAALARRAASCSRCGLRAGCRGVVFGEGDPDATILLLGEGPGRTEDELGRPFVGTAGQLLDKILLAVGFSREEVYITNTVLCRPPGNRSPLPEEVAACRVWLDERLAVMDPRIIVCLGASAAQALIGSDLRITRDRGRWYRRGGARVMPTFHPAALLRDPSKKRDVWEDMKAVRAAWSALHPETP